MDWQTLLYNFITLMVVLDPVGTSAVFAALTPDMDSRQRRYTAEKATMLSTLILVVFAFLGAKLLAAMGVSLPAFRIAGGLMLFFLAIDMVFARPSGFRSSTAAENREAEERHDITVFPLAFPLIAGPGAMTTVVLLMGRANGNPLQVISVLGVLLTVLVVVLVLLYTASGVRKLLGVTGSNVITRVLGIILAALAVQFVLDGLVEVFKS
ncbi:MAG TPA: MarC family protein [Magnetospirillaceae bacterium]|nr:MarC family protein [Magnetospirillaceae bacterium]